MYIDLNTPHTEIQNLLNSIDFLDTSEQILSIEKPGEGNMNVVLRIKTNKRSFIVKQSRPFVQKYQDIEAPVDRIDVEFRFYNALKNDVIKSHTPKVFKYHRDKYLLILEDLGACKDMSFLYENRNVEVSQIDLLTDIVFAIHREETPVGYPKNRALRLLNHQHIFVLPFLEDTGFSLDTIQNGLEELSMKYRTDNILKKEIDKIGALYLTEGDVLLHGDYYPGSWMIKEEYIYVLDPEFSFKGFAEFDLGVMAAHMLMINIEKDVLKHIQNRYSKPLDLFLLEQVTGIEIMRRLIGLAQLPLKRTLSEKKKLLEIAYNLIIK